MGANTPARASALVETLRAAPDVLADLVRSVPAGRLDVRRRPHFWTIRDHIVHLADVQPMLLGRIERFRDEEHPSFIPFIPDDAEADDGEGGEPESAGEPPDGGARSTEPQSVEAAVEAFRECRDRQIRLIESLSAEVWERRASHPEYSLYSTSILIRHIAMHDHWHMYRVEELWLTRDEFLTEVE